MRFRRMGEARLNFLGVFDQEIEMDAHGFILQFARIVERDLFGHRRDQLGAMDQFLGVDRG